MCLVLEVEYIVLVPTAEQLKPLAFGRFTVHRGWKQKGDDGWAEISNTAKQNIVYLHSASISSEQSSELPERGTRVIPTVLPGTTGSLKMETSLVAQLSINS